MALSVFLLRHIPAPEKTIAFPAKLCCPPLGIAQLREKNAVADSVLEHASFTFNWGGISRVTSPVFENSGPIRLTKPGPEGKLTWHEQAKVKQLFTEMEERLSGNL